MTQLNGKVALVTGAARGIGNEIAKTMLEAGGRVIIADLSLEDSQAAAKALDPSLKNAMAVQMNVTSEDEVDKGFEKAIAHFGGVDILVSNAGIQIVNPIEDYKFSDWKKMLAIQLDGAFLTTRAAVRDMYKRKKGGSIIYIGSVHSKEASPLKSAYVTAKHGLVGLARVVAKEGAPHGVRANVICPGFVRTALVEKQIPEQAKELGISQDDVVKKVMLGQTVDGEFTTVQDVARSVLFFADFETNALTGQSLIVSHGWVME